MDGTGDSTAFNSCGQVDVVLIHSTNTHQHLTLVTHKDNQGAITLFKV